MSNEGENIGGLCQVITISAQTAQSAQCKSAALSGVGAFSAGNAAP